MSTWDSPKGGPESNRRRSQRVIVSVAIVVCNETGNKHAAFEEETQTLVVNAHGALLALTARVETGQTLLLKNHFTKQEQSCKVVYLGTSSAGKTQVAVDFIEPAPDFWHIAFPPEGWMMPGALPQSHSKK